MRGVRDTSLLRSRWIAGLLAATFLLGFAGADFHVLLEAPGAHEVGGESVAGDLRADCAHPGSSRHVEAASKAERPECAVVVSLTHLRSVDPGGVSIGVDRSEGTLGVPAPRPLASSILDRSASPRGPPLG